MIPRLTAFLGNILRQPVLKRIMEHTEPMKRPRSPSPQQAEAPEAKRPHIELAPVPAAVQVDAEEAMFNVEEEIQSGKGRRGKRGNGGQARKEKKEKRDAKDPRAQRAWEPREKTDGEKRLPKRRCAVLIGWVLQLSGRSSSFIANVVTVTVVLDTRVCKCAFFFIVSDRPLANSDIILDKTTPTEQSKAKSSLLLSKLALSLQIMLSMPARLTLLELLEQMPVSTRLAMSSPSK